jgi:hypothetical protein
MAVAPAAARVARLRPSLTDRARARWTVLAAALALVVPVLLLTDVDSSPRSRPAAAQAKVVKQVIVKRQRIVRREVVVQQVPAPSPAPRVPDPVVIVKKVPAPAPKKAAPKSEPVVEADVTPTVPEAPAAAPATGSSSGSSPRR